MKLSEEREKGSEGRVKRQKNCSCTGTATPALLFATLQRSPSFLKLIDTLSGRAETTTSTTTTDQRERNRLVPTESAVIRGYLSLAFKKFLPYPPQHLSYFRFLPLLRSSFHHRTPSHSRDLLVLASNGGPRRLRQITEISLKGLVPRTFSIFMTFKLPVVPPPTVTPGEEWKCR